MKVEVASPDPNCPYGLCGREAMLKKKKKGRGVTVALTERAAQSWPTETQVAV